METFEEKVHTTFRTLKRFDKHGDYICIPILDDKEDIIGMLKPICKDYRTMYPGCVSLLGKWRASNPSLSNSVFTVTNERTMHWLDNLVLANPDRMFFLIDDLQNNHLGHIALSHFDYVNESGFIDSVLRGERCTVHNLMYHTVMSLQRWMVHKLGCKHIYLVTNTDNDRAINLYKRCGFVPIKREPLFRCEMENEVRWDADPDRNPSEAERYEYLMESDYTRRVIHVN